MHGGRMVWPKNPENLVALQMDLKMGYFLGHGVKVRVDPQRCP